MSDHSSTFLLVTILVLLTIVLIVAMRYFFVVHMAKLTTTVDGDWKVVVNSIKESQNSTAVSLATLQADTAEIKSRLAAIEKILRDVD